MPGVPKRVAINRLHQLKRRANLLADDEPLSADFHKWRRDTEVTLEHIFGAESRHLRDFAEIRYDLPYVGGSTGGEEQAAHEEGLERAASILLSMVVEIRQYWEDDHDAAAAQEPPEGDAKREVKPDSKKVFIVHGHDDAMKESVARTLTTLGLRPIILHEQTNRGQTVIEKFEKNSDVPFAIVLLSPDDYGYSQNASPDTKKLRARQNVIMELGFFIAKLGRERVLPLYRGGSDFEMPSDYAGVVYTPYDQSGNWRFKLAQELKACGFQVDANALL